MALALLACPGFAAAQENFPLTIISSAVQPAPKAGRAARPQRAELFGVAVSQATRRVADWVVASNDNGGRPFVIIDKIATKVYVFNQYGQLRGSSFVLLGAAVGDDSTPGIGTQKLSNIGEAERTTPAGRFVAALGSGSQHDVLWIDYALSLAMHRVVRGNPGDHRLQRLSTTSTADKRISYGCVNVPARFFDDYILPAFTGTSGLVYILPEIKTLSQVFPQIGPPDRVSETNQKPPNS